METFDRRREHSVSAQFVDARLLSDLRYGQLISTVRSTARRTLTCSADAEEVVQEVMLELWAKAGQFDWERANPQAWATTVTKRRCIDRIRSEQARKRREDRVNREERPRLSIVAEDVIVRFDRDRVVEALDVLNPNQREAIVLAYFGDCTYAEVARTLGLPEGTVKRRIRDGMRRMRVKLADLR